MELQGDKLLSPLVQTSQQLQVNAMLSSTSLPLNYYQTRPLMLPQGVFECFPPAQVHPFNPYQVYGGDARVQPSSFVSSVPSQQNFTQGSNFYQQPVSHVMLQQPQQSQAYHIQVHSQSNMRHSTPSHQPQMMFTSQNIVPTSNVILVPSSMYPAAKAPLDPPNTFVQGSATCSNFKYYPNKPPASCEPGIQPIAAPPPPVQLNKKVLSIMDPDTGRDISVELFSTSSEQHDEEISTANQNDNKVCQTFSRLTADRLKSPDHFITSCVSADSREADISVSTISAVGVPSNQQYQPPLSKQHEQQQQPSFMTAAIMVRPLTTGPHTFLQAHHAMPQQTRFTASQPHNTQNEVPAVNLRMSPPPYFLQQSTQLLSNTIWQQHQYPSSHPFPAHTQPFQQQQQQQPIKLPGIAMAHPLLQQNSTELLQSQHPPSQPAHNQPPNIVGDPVPVSQKVEICVTDEQKPLMGATPPDSMPIKPTEPPSSGTEEPSAVSSALPQMAECADSRSSSGEEAIIFKSPADMSRAEASLEVISQDMKDGLNANNNNINFNSKEIEELGVGEILDSFESTQETKSDSVKTTVESNIINLLGNSERDKDTKTKVIAKYVTQRDAVSSCDIQSDTETSTTRDYKNLSVVMELDSVHVKLLNVDGASGESDKDNITRTNKTLHVASAVAGPSGAMVQHNEQEVLEAKSVFIAPVPENADWEAQRHVPLAESRDTRHDRCSSSDESASAQQVAETQEQAATRPRGRASRLERFQRKLRLKTQTKQKINSCSSPSQYTEVQSRVVETNEGLARVQLAIECKLSHESAGEDNKTSSVPFALSQELSNMTNVQVHMVTPTQPDDAEKKVVPIMQTETKPNVEASQSPSKPAAINITDPTKHQNQPQTEKTRNTAEISHRTQAQVDSQNSNTLESGLAIAVHAELEPTITINIVSDSFKADYSVTDEDQTLESVPMPENEDIQKGQPHECSSTAASRQ